MTHRQSQAHCERYIFLFLPFFFFFPACDYIRCMFTACNINKIQPKWLCQVMDAGTLVWPQRP